MYNFERLPDVTSYHHSDNPLLLQWVGMEGIAVPFSMAILAGENLQIAAKADLFVSLDSSTAKGIHMSRLYLLLNSQLAGKTLDRTTLEQLLDSMVDSQANISESARVNLDFELLLNKNALLSGESGYQSYPIKLKTEKRKGIFSTELEIVIPYSSTCPCSASLSRQLYSDAIDAQFGDAKIDKAALLAWVQSEAGSIATPHSQRSYAYIRISLSDHNWPDIPKLISQLESVIGTPVQTAVKRVDEQEFARLNAQNLIFCEDVARRIKSALESMPFAVNYWFKVEHQESLHAHNAVVIDQKDV